ncbi:MAG: ATP-binding protein [Terriglobales bacterium]|jgi:two-component system, OmpR family, sensor histidine kinase CpxA
MKSLFLKIFLSFWAAWALSLVLAILVTIALRPARHGIESEAPQILAEVVNAYQSGGERSAHDYLEELWHTQHVRAFVFDPSGQELSGRRVPPWIEEARQGGTTQGVSPRRHGWIDDLLPDRIMRQALTLDGKRYTIVLELPPGRRVFFGAHDIPGLWITIAVILSGLVCYLLAWSVTSPVTRLRQAVQGLAGGDLGARTGAPVGGRRDELTELMRDFDRMAERIEGLVDSQSRLLKDVSHELRSPLARLSVALGLARQRATSEVAPELAPELESALNRIELEADRLNQLIQRLLTISRLESGSDGMRKTTLSLRELVEQVAHDAEYETRGRGCQVTTGNTADATARADAFLVEADPDLLRSAVENVVRNATRYTAEGTTVEVRLERQQTAHGEEEIIVRVLDCGPGVPEEALPKIFEPFYRLDDARNRQTGGAGLGLSIADRAIRLHGGQLRASNRKEGGLEVEIRIPAAPGFALPAHS